MVNKPRVILVHSEVRTYREPIFAHLNKAFKTTFLFCSPGKRFEQKTDKASYNYLYFKNYRLPFYSADVTPGLFWYFIRHRHDFDLVIFSGIFSFSTHFCFYLIKWLRKPVILWDETWVIPQTKASLLILPYIKRLVKSASACIAAGTKAKELYIKLGADPKKVFIAPNSTPDISTEIDHQLTQRLKEKWQIPTKAQVISYMGRVVAYKNLDCLIKAFVQIRPHFPQAILFIAGDGPYASYCQELIDKLGSERIIWAKEGGNTVEPIDHHEFIHFYDFTDIFVLPGRFILQDSVPCEAWGLTLNEAMSLGKVVITTESVAAGFDLIKSGQNGYLVKPDDSEDLADSLTKAMSQLDLKEAAKVSRSIINQDYSYLAMGKGFESAVEFALTKSGAKSTNPV